ncbi:MAG: CPBP family intramembrane metalloprotease [Bacteroidetes bacterium]|nr:MAG: CPBP family intramembrane metalloprotease [Bacteroidota bacterium]
MGQAKPMFLPMTPHAFILRAREGKNPFWMYLVGILLVFLANILGSLPYTLVASLRMAERPVPLSPEELTNPMALGLHPAIGLFLLLLSFAAGVLALWFMMRFLHERPFLSLVNIRDRFNLEKFGTAAGVWMALMAGFELVAYFMDPDNYTFTFEAWAFFPTLLVALIMVPIQTSMEELLFRGYLLQGLGLGTRRPWLALLLTSIGFGLLHGANPEVATFGPLILLYYIGFGLAMALVTLMDEGLELALGVHAANNVYGALFVTFPSSAMQTPALFTLSEYPVTLMTVVWVVATLIFIGFVAYRYQWQDWAKLWRPLAPASPAEEPLEE